MRWLLIIFSNVNYFNLSLLNFFVGSTNEFFHSCCKLFLTGIANYFLLLDDNYFFTGAENYFFIGAENYFSRYRELIFWPTIHCGLAIEGDWLQYFRRILWVVNIWRWINLFNGRHSQ